MKMKLALALSGFLSMATLTHAATLPSAETAANASNAFAIDLYPLISHREGNLCISPYSISSALGMASTGAAGETKNQMLSTLHWTGSPASLPDSASALATAMKDGETKPDAAQLQIAETLFGQKGFAYRQEFLDLLASKYGAALQTVDFSGNPTDAAAQINHWAADQTHDRIKQVIDPSSIKPLTRLVLVNAVYFKDEWISKFNTHGTADLPFFVDGKDSANVSTMRQQHYFNYFETDSMQAMEMPYRGGCSMVVLLPRAHDGLPALEKSLTADGVAGWMKQAKPKLLLVNLPKFQIEGGFQLAEPLAKLGMTDAFDSVKADFSGITTAQRLNIDAVIHKTFIKLDEAGTEAAAVTAITAVASSAFHREKPPEPIVFNADHPFLYILRHQATGTILFMGRVTDPR
jgi:serpin B